MKTSRPFAVIWLSIPMLAGGPPPGLAQDPPSFVFEEIAALGDSVEGEAGVEIEFDFEVGEINDRGDIAFGADLCRKEGEACTGIGEGVFLRTADGKVKPLAISGNPAPGGVTYTGAFRGRVTINQEGSVAFTFDVGPNIGISGLFLYNADTGRVQEIVLPGQPAPGGGSFVHVGSDPVINDRNEIVFSAWVTGADINPGEPPEVRNDDRKIGGGIFRRREDGVLEAIDAVQRPGDRGPSLESRGGPAQTVFDFGIHPWTNDLGDIAFGGHLDHMECLEFGETLCGESIFLKGASSAEFVPIALQEDPVAGGRIFRIAFVPVINDRGDILFQGDLSPKPGTGEVVSLFLHTGGALHEVLKIKPEGDPMPGGGRLRDLTFGPGQFYLNRCGDIAILCTLDSKSLSIDGDPDLEPDQGLFVRSGGQWKTVVRTGMELPGLGTLLALLPPDFLDLLDNGFAFAWFNAAINDRGQVPFMASIRDGTGTVRGVLLLATPTGAWPCGEARTSFTRGDADANGQTNLTDGVFILNGLFLGGDPPPCADAADTDDNGVINLTDGVYVLNHLFLGGPAPPAPNPDCGVEGEPDADSLTCESFPPCVTR